MCAKKVLLPCGGGAMGRYAAKELLNKGYHVDILDNREIKIDHPNYRCIIHDGFDRIFMKNLLETEKYDGIIDFMIYHTHQFAERFEMYLENTDHYVFLSTYRIYANYDEITTEQSPRLLDVSTDKEFIDSEDYSLFKARCENILRASKYDNWTIVRPAITYSEYRYQLVTLEAESTISRMLEGKEIVLPKDAMDVEATMSWAGDLGKMYAGILFNPKSYKETYTFATAEHNPWKYVAKCYEEILGAKIRWIDKEDYLKIVSGGEIQNCCKWQLEFDRLFDRRMDNSKVLEHTGLRQEDLTPLKDGLKMMLEAVDLKSTYTSGKFDYYMDKYLEENK